MILCCSHGNAIIASVIGTLIVLGVMSFVFWFAYQMGATR